jgi:hypothetical protein
MAENKEWKTTLRFGKGDTVKHKTSEVVGVITDCNVKPFYNMTVYCVHIGDDEIWAEETAFEPYDVTQKKIGGFGSH